MFHSSDHTLAGPVSVAWDWLDHFLSEAVHFKVCPLLKPQLNPMQQGNPCLTLVWISLLNGNFFFSLTITIMETEGQ